MKPARPAITKRERELLAGLVSRHGADRIKRAVDRLSRPEPPGKPGRPPFNPGYGRWAAYWAAIEAARDRGPNLRRRSATQAADFVRQKIKTSPDGGSYGFPPMSTKGLADIYREQERRRRSDPEYAGFLRMVLERHQWWQKQLRDPDQVFVVPLSISAHGVEKYGLDKPGYRLRQ